MNRLPLSQLLSLTILGLALGMISATLEPGLLGLKVLELTPDRRNTILGVTTFVGLLVAILTQPIMGALSDRTRSPWGRRLPFLAAGTLFSIVSLIWVAAAPDLALLLFGVIALQIGSNTIQGPWQALLPDQVPYEQLGLASGFKVLWEGMAAVLGRVIAGQLLAREPEWGSLAIAAAIAVPIVTLVVAFTVTALGITTRGANASNLLASLPAPAETPPPSPMFNLRALFAIDLRAYPAFGWWFLNRILFWCALIGIGVFLLFFAIDVVGLTRAQAQGYMGQVSAVLGGALLLIAIPVSRLADRVPRKPIVFAAGLIAGTGTLVVLATRDLTLITLGGAIIGAGAGMYVIASWALILEIVPQAKAARYLGVANIASAAGSAIARVAGGTLIDALNTAVGSHATGYLTVYAVAAALFFLSALAVLPLRLPRQGEQGN